MNRVGAKMFEWIYSNMMTDKKREWQILSSNTLIKWTLIRLPFIVDGAEKGSIKENLLDMPGTRITNQDIATFIINQVASQEYVQKSPFISN
ncbi:hypothetical protein [Metabacillus endolithicus]|uniref:NAD(P)-binding domain-containing protein n=1 Tax=Metabacillus endolithicus TaxID=1535204 RepID=A0ABW5BTG1_9BACI|nr:hypothetical protein [Metabacillus endolithicus]UPG63749.1 hypothetical protein MVE64_00805 [Metabacillus endolithicus]